MAYVKMLLTLNNLMKSALLLCVAFLAVAVQAQPDSVDTGDPRVKWHVDAVTEGQWNIKTVMPTG